LGTNSKNHSNGRNYKPRQKMVVEKVNKNCGKPPKKTFNFNRLNLLIIE